MELKYLIWKKSVQLHVSPCYVTHPEEMSLVTFILLFLEKIYYAFNSLFWVWVLPIQLRSTQSSLFPYFMVTFVTSWRLITTCLILPFIHLQFFCLRLQSNRLIVGYRWIIYFWSRHFLRSRCLSCHFVFRATSY